MTIEKLKGRSGTLHLSTPAQPPAWLLRHSCDQKASCSFMSVEMTYEFLYYSQRFFITAWRTYSFFRTMFTYPIWRHFLCFGPSLPLDFNSLQLNCILHTHAHWGKSVSQRKQPPAPAIHNEESRRELTDLSVVFPVKIALALALVSGKDFMYESYKCFARARRSADSGFSWSISLEISANSFSFSACGIRPNLMATEEEEWQDESLDHY